MFFVVPTKLESSPACAGTSTGHYEVHLAEVNEDRPVTVVEDIYNAQGVLLARKGLRLDRGMARRLVESKLMGAVEGGIAIEGTFTSETIGERLSTLTSELADLGALHDRSRFAEDYRRILERPLPPLVAQKLTVLSHRFPEVFAHTVVGAWLAALFGRELGLRGEALEALHLAALARDAGLLHISPSIAENQEPEALSTEDWRALQSHVVVGKLLLGQMKQVGAEAQAAVLEHHERWDGSGYPTGASGAALSLWGQIVATADGFAVCRMRYLARARATIGAVLWVIPPTLMHPEVYRVAAALVGPAQLALGRGEDRAKLVNEVLGRARALEGVEQQLQRLPKLDGRTPEGRAKLRQMQQLADQLGKMLRSSGMGDPEMIRWLGEARGGAREGDHAEVLRMEFQQGAILWQIGTLRNLIAEIVALEGQPEDGPLMTFSRHLAGDIPVMPAASSP